MQIERFEPYDFDPPDSEQMIVVLLGEKEEYPEFDVFLHACLQEISLSDFIEPEMRSITAAEAISVGLSCSIVRITSAGSKSWRISVAAL